MAVCLDCQMSIPSQLEYAYSLIKDVADFPNPGILFKDITPLLQDEKAFSLPARLTKRFHELWFVVWNRPRGDFGIHSSLEHCLWYSTVAHLALVSGRSVVYVHLHLRWDEKGDHETKSGRLVEFVHVLVKATPRRWRNRFITNGDKREHTEEKQWK